MKFSAGSLNRFFFLSFIIFYWATSGFARPGIESPRQFIIQPYGKISKALINDVYQRIKLINPNVKLNSQADLPISAYYSPRGRYRADSIIHYLSRKTARGNVIIGMTSKDVSTTKGEHKDWGVMGLGFRPGNACVVSTYRLSKKNLTSQLFKVSIHELGHTEGLPHCKDPHCYMRNAQGGNHLEEETDFCRSCKSYLRKKGWRL
jgi:archaemetzincin